MTKRPLPDSSLDESTEKSGSAPGDSISSGETLLRAEGGARSDDHQPPLLEGRYEVNEKDGSALLGRGGQGTVWRAYDKVLQREVALEKVHGAASADAATVAAFLREARLTALLEHPGIVPLHDVGRGADGVLYIALRRIEGKSLAWSHRRPQQSELPPVALTLLEKTCSSGEREDCVAWAESRAPP